MKLIYEVTGGPKNLDSIYLVNRRLAGDQPNGGNRYDVIEMCAPAAPPIMLRIRTRSLNPNPKPLTLTLTLELTLTLTVFLSVTGTKFLKENKTGRK